MMKTTERITIDPGIWEEKEASNWYLNVIDYLAREQEEILTDGEGSFQVPKNHIRIWGILQDSDESIGFGLFFDDDWNVVLEYKGKMVARYYPQDYTMPELRQRIARAVRIIRRIPFVICAAGVQYSEN